MNELQRLIDAIQGRVDEKIRSVQKQERQRQAKRVKYPTLPTRVDAGDVCHVPADRILVVPPGFRVDGALKADGPVVMVSFAAPDLRVWRVDYQMVVPASFGAGTHHLDYATPLYDPHGLVTTGTGWVFTSPRAAIYQVIAWVKLTPQTGSSWSGETALLYTHSTYGAKPFAVEAAPAGTDARFVRGLTTLYLGVGDTISVSLQTDIPVDVDQAFAPTISITELGAAR